MENEISKSPGGLMRAYIVISALFLVLWVILLVLDSAGVLNRGGIFVSDRQFIWLFMAPASLGVTIAGVCFLITAIVKKMSRKVNIGLTAIIYGTVVFSLMWFASL